MINKGSSYLALSLSGAQIAYKLENGDPCGTDIAMFTGSAIQMAAEKKAGKVALKTIGKWGARAAVGIGLGIVGVAAAPWLGVLAAVAMVAWTVIDTLVFADAVSQIITGQGLGANLMQGIDWTRRNPQPYNPYTSGK
jgi:hypothetical protein